MKNKPFSSLLFLSVLLILSAPAHAGELIDKVAAVVNDEVITQSELDEMLGPLYAQYKTMYTGEELMKKMGEARRTLLNQLIEDRLVFQEAKKLKVDVSEEEISQRVNEFKARFKNPEEFEKLLAQQGITLSKLREKYKEQIAIQKLHQYHVRSHIVVTPKEIDEYYTAHLNKFTAQEMVKARTITIRKSEDAVARKEPDPKARARAEEVLKKVYQGTDFGELAKQYSEDTKAAEGGELGMVARGDLVNTIDEVIFNLKPGEVSSVLETPMGYHLFKVEERQEKATRSLDDVREDIREMVYREKSNGRFKEWMEDLKKNAYISIR